MHTLESDHARTTRREFLLTLPKEAEYAHPRGWPARPDDAVRRMENNYVLPDILAKAINGMPTKRAMEWAQGQVVLAVRGQLKTAA